MQDKPNANILSSFWMNYNWNESTLEQTITELRNASVLLYYGNSHLRIVFLTFFQKLNCDIRVIAQKNAYDGNRLTEAGSIYLVTHFPKMLLRILLQK